MDSIVNTADAAVVVQLVEMESKHTRYANSGAVIETGTAPTGLPTQGIDT